MHRFALLTITLILAAGGIGFASAKPSPKNSEPTVPTVDITDVKAKLQIFTDGKGHYVAVVPFDDIYKHTYYGDGKQFFTQRISGGGRSGDTQWNRTFWEPRVDALWKSSIRFQDNVLSVQCGDRETPFTPLADEDRAKLVENAIFHETIWKYKAYALARDSKGTYYYVDQPRDESKSKAFRLFSGLRGKLKPLAMTNVVSDSQGDIFTTKSGELRLVLDKKRSVWFDKKAERELVALPLDENRMLIYSDLGVYTGQRLGTPCDDLL